MANVAVCNEWIVSGELSLRLPRLGLFAGRNLELSANVAKKVAANSATANEVIKAVIAAIETAIMKYGFPWLCLRTLSAIALAGSMPFMTMIPLFIASGLFFGVIPGGVLNVVGATVAAVFAANASRAS